MRQNAISLAAYYKTLSASARCDSTFFSRQGMPGWVEESDGPQGHPTPIKHREP